MTEPVGSVPAPRRVVPLLGVEVTPATALEVSDFILGKLSVGAGAIVGNLNLHGVYMFHTNSRFREYCDRSDLILIDGAPIAWAAGVPSSKRVGSTDWLDSLMPRADGLTVFAIGGTPDASHRAAAHMNANYPAVNWVGVDGYSSQSLSPELLYILAGADVVLVGMGMPLQEDWILRTLEHLRGKVVANVGGCIDYYAGTQRLAPRWMGRFGLEWAYRLLVNPRRLAYRYLVEPFKLAGVLIAVHTGRKR